MNAKQRDQAGERLGQQWPAGTPVRVAGQHGVWVVHPRHNGLPHNRVRVWHMLYGRKDVPVSALSREGT